MSKNYRLVEYFVSEFYMERPEELGHIISPTFIFKNSIGVELNFAQYVAYLSSYLAVSEIKINGISSKNDINFLVDFTVKPMDNTTSDDQEISDKVEVIVENNFIKSVGVSFK